VPAVYVIETIVGIGVLVLVHEFGHFLFAKLSNVKVERFSIGFGPEIAGVTRGDTRYSLCVFPLGGYVKMLGEELGSESAPDARSFLAQPFAKRALIFVAGSIFNILLGLVLFIAVFRMGITFPAARIGAVEFDSPAHYAGLEVGDAVEEINGRGNVDFVDLQTAAALSNPGQTLKLRVLRDGRALSVTVRPEFSRSIGMGYIGVNRYPTLEIGGFVRIDSRKSPVAAAGVPMGSVITAFNGKPMTSWFDFERRAVANGLVPFKLTVRRGTAEQTFVITALRNPGPLLGVFATMSTEVTKVVEDSQAAAMGLAAGDAIVGIGDTKAADLLGLRDEIAARIAKLPPLKVIRAGKELELPWTKPPESAADFISGFEVKPLPIVAWVQPDTPADVLGMTRGDTIVAVDGKEVKEFTDIKAFMSETKGDTIAVSWTHNGVTLNGSFQPAFLGIVPGVQVIERKLGWFAASSLGVRKAWDFGTQVYLLIKKAFTGQGAIAKNLSGPVGIASLSYKVAEQGFSQFLFLMAIIAVNFGIVNLLPIPVLDGGNLAILIVEKIKGSPLSARTQAALQYTGLVIIVALFLWVTWHDIARIIAGR